MLYPSSYFGTVQSGPVLGNKDTEGSWRVMSGGLFSSFRLTKALSSALEALKPEQFQPVDRRFAG